MPGSFDITAPTNTVRLRGNTKAEAAFTVFNQSGQQKTGRAQLAVSRPEVEAWLTVRDGLRQDFEIAGTSQYTVDIEVPPGAPSGDYSFRLNMVGVENPDDDFSEGPSVAFSVLESEAPQKQIPWKIPAIIAAAVVLIAVVAFAVINLTGSKWDLLDESVSEIPPAVDDSTPSGVGYELSPQPGGSDDTILVNVEWSGSTIADISVTVALRNDEGKCRQVAEDSTGTPASLNITSDTPAWQDCPVVSGVTTTSDIADGKWALYVLNASSAQISNAKVQARYETSSN